MWGWTAGLAVLLALAGPANAQLFDKSKFFGSGLDSETLQGAAPYGSPIRNRGRSPGNQAGAAA